MLEAIHPVLEQFRITDLESLNKAALLNRQDKKFVFAASGLPDLLSELLPDYYLLKIDRQSVFTYKTLYFDTPELAMFYDHVRGKLNRYKVRRRHYVDSGITYLEIKFKNNKDRTIKYRTLQPSSAWKEEPLDEQFLQNRIPFMPADLVPVLENNFQRISLVDLNFTHRITLDMNVSFHNLRSSFNGEAQLNNLAILELKTPRELTYVPVRNVLRDHRVLPSGISKYCVGKSLTEHEPQRTNQMKPKLRQLEKISKHAFYTS